jgi:Sulfatase
MTSTAIPQRFQPLWRIGATLSAVMVLFSLQRLAFFLLNRSSFTCVGSIAFVGGLRFDASAIAWLYAPWILCILIAPAVRGTWHRVQTGFFLLSSGVCFFLNCIDLEYFKFTLKRSSADLFGIASGGDDLAHLVPVFVKDYWYVVVFFLGSMVLAFGAYRFAARRWPQNATKPWWLWRLVVIIITLLCSRGGVQYMPLTIVDASAYAQPAHMTLVLNSPFTVMTTIGKPVIEERTFMPQADADRIWPVVHRYGEAKLVPTGSNVVVIVLESFSGTYSSLLNGGREGYMPFLDSLMSQGLYYTNAHANGRRSIDGLPAIMASMPKMMEEAFITSPYADAPFTALPGLLATKGYSTSFYHGGHNGTMGFDAFARSAGFQRYVGRNEYPIAEDDDGIWGIRDQPFLQFYARELSKEQQPFMSAVFTLSSHHPYQLPKAEAERFAGGKLTIHPTLKYADNALREFFATASGMPWFKNTLFVITADHTADLERNGEQSGSAFDFWIPLVYYMPGVILPQSDVRTTQQIDILPTVMDMLGHREPFFAFGSSTLRLERPPAAVSQGSATWLLVDSRVQLRSDGANILWHDGVGSSWNPKEKTVPNAFDMVTAHLLLQASIQQFNTHLLHRDMVVKE